jgi:formate-nitrite transporter family protein
MSETKRTGVTDHLAVPVSATDHALGSANALVTLVEYGDFECPFCARSYPAVKALRRRFGERLRFVFRHFPRPEHPHARQAAEAAEAAAAQGEEHFWQMHDWLFEHQQTLELAALLNHAREAGLDAMRFQTELEQHVYRERVHADIESGVHSGVHGTPTFFVNGFKHEGPDTYEDLLEAIEAHLPDGDAPLDDPVDEASRESFPASDPSGLSGSHA